MKEILIHEHHYHARRNHFAKIIGFHYVDDHRISICIIWILPKHFKSGKHACENLRSLLQNNDDHFPHSELRSFRQATISTMYSLLIKPNKLGP